MSVTHPKRLNDFIASGLRGAQDGVAFAECAGVHPAPDEPIDHRLIGTGPAARRPPLPPVLWPYAPDGAGDLRKAPRS